MRIVIITLMLVLLVLIAGCGDRTADDAVKPGMQAPASTQEEVSSVEDDINSIDTLESDLDMSELDTLDKDLEI